MIDAALVLPEVTVGITEASITRSIEQSVRGLVNVLPAKQGKPGPEYLDYLGRTVPW